MAVLVVAEPPRGSSEAALLVGCSLGAESGNRQAVL